MSTRTNQRPQPAPERRSPSVYVFSPRDARSIDRLCRTRFGISTIVLMENAAVHVAAGAMQLGPPDRLPRALVIVGTGNNGGDGLGAARHLSNFGAEVSILLVGDATALSADAAVQLKTCRRMRLPVALARSSLKTALPAALRELGNGWPDVVVDGLFGTGLSREVEGIALETIQVINGLRAKGVRALAIDIPSGLDAASGRPLGAAVYADMTVTFVGLKAGMLKPEAIEHLGRVAIADIGVPRTLVESLGKRVAAKPGAGGVRLI